MKTLFTAATLAAAFALVGCHNNKAHDHDAAPGATSGTCCGTDGSCCKAAPGAVSSDAGCASSCSDSAAPGAVSSESGCASSCSDAAAPVAVSSEPASCGSSCSDKMDKMEKLGGGCPMSGPTG